MGQTVRVAMASTAAPDPGSSGRCSDDKQPWGSCRWKRRQRGVFILELYFLCLCLVASSILLAETKISQTHIMLFLSQKHLAYSHLPSKFP